jgi:hypothetical protein
MEFRLLRADEIDVRIAMVQSWGISLLLYKDARCDQNILDETVGSMNWQRHHNRDNANCIVSIWDEAKQQWIEKEDTGTESNTEREKGLASDSFKRACFNWGIGRELYTSPAMFVKPNKLKTFKTENGRFTCKDRFRVNDIIYSGKKIVKVDVLNESTGEVIVFGETPEEKQKEQEVKEKKIGKVKGKALEKMLTDAGQDIEKIKAYYKFTKFEDLTEQQHQMIVSGFQKAQEGKNGRKRTN